MHYLLYVCFLKREWICILSAALLKEKKIIKRAFLLQMKDRILYWRMPALIKMLCFYSLLRLHYTHVPKIVIYSALLTIFCMYVFPGHSSVLWHHVCRSADRTADWYYLRHFSDKLAYLSHKVLLLHLYAKLSYKCRAYLNFSQTSLKL